MKHYCVLPLESSGAGAGVSDSSYYFNGFLGSRQWEEREKEMKEVWFGATEDLPELAWG